MKLIDPNKPLNPEELERLSSAASADILDRFGRIPEDENGRDFPKVTGGVRLQSGAVVRFDISAEDCTITAAIESAIAEARKQSRQGSGATVEEHFDPKKDTAPVAMLATVMWMRSRGRFFWDAETKVLGDSFYFDNADGRLLRIGSDEFKAWLANGTKYIREDKQYKRLYSFIQDAAMDKTVSVGVVPFSYYGRKDDAVYISCGESQMVKCYHGKTTLVRNGTDGVVFLADKTLPSWRLLPDETAVDDPFLTLRMFKNAAFETSSGIQTLKAWYLSIFACDKSRPILLITGQWQSGKTALGQGLIALIGLDYNERDDQVDAKGEEDFWTKVNFGGIRIFDNIEDEIADAKWFPSAVERIGTGGSKSKRTLYKNTELTVYHSAANVILTSKNPMFAQNAGLADRLQIVRLYKFREKNEGQTLFDEIAQHRDEAMTWTARVIAAALDDNGEVESGVNLRHPDYGDFALHCANAMGCYKEMLAALKCSEIEKTVIVLRQVEEASDVLDFLTSRGGRWEGQIKSLVADMFQGEAMDDGERARIEKRFGRMLAQYRGEFSVCFPGYEVVKRRGVTTHVFQGIDDRLNEMNRGDAT